MNKSELEHVVTKVREAKDGGFGALSTSEQLAAALVLNRADWLAGMGYTFAQAIDRIGLEWVMLVPKAERILQQEEDAA